MMELDVVYWAVGELDLDCSWLELELDLELDCSRLELDKIWN